MDGYIKLDRQLLEWGWFKNPKTLSVWVALLLLANWKDGEFMGQTVKRGQLITSYKRLAERTGLSVSEVRTAIKHLILTKEITAISQGLWTLITVEKYGVFQSQRDEASQGFSTEVDKAFASSSQGFRKAFATIEERKNEKREEFKNERISLLTDEESSSIKARIRQAAEERRRHGA